MKLFRKVWYDSALSFCDFKELKKFFDWKQKLI